MSNSEFLKGSIAEERKRLLEEQNNICPLCNTYIREDEAVVDHSHIDKHIRAALHSVCNSYEGIVLHKFRRSGAHKKTDIITYLLNLIKFWQTDFSENYLHPSEKPKRPKIGKREFNKLNNWYKKKYPNRKQLIYPKSGKWTDNLSKLLNEKFYDTDEGKQYKLNKEKENVDKK